MVTYGLCPIHGDAGNSLGAACAIFDNKVNWEGPYLGHDIQTVYPVETILDELLTNRIVGVASGKAEFGPRALGNRSILADPRGPDIKDLVNTYKKREKFRPFAPVILEECVHEYFDVQKGFTSPYMQFVATCKYPQEFPAIVHVDGTSRIQTVNSEQHSGLYELLKKFKDKTGSPMLLNTSLNIKGKPLLNYIDEVSEFMRKYNLNVVF